VAPSVSIADAVIAACAKEWRAHKADASGFAKAVAAKLGVSLTGQANDIIRFMRANWSAAADGANAGELAAQGKLVVGGLEDQPHGHVVIVVKGDLELGVYPRAYWGLSDGAGRESEPISTIWSPEKCGLVEYYYTDLSTPTPTSHPRRLSDDEPKLAIPRLHRMLVDIHTDLFKIDRFVRRFGTHGPDSLSNLEKLTIVLEDRRFASHRGVDLRSVAREVLKKLKFMRHGGASTIDMQLVRTVTGYRAMTIRRKTYEAILSVIIQFRYNKITILRTYLGCAFFGSHLGGAQAAAQKVFMTDHSDLTLEQAAFVAAMLVYPRPLAAPPTWEIKVERRAQYGIRVYLAHKERFDKFPA
jgi:hypothetical protein